MFRQSDNYNRVIDWETGKCFVLNDMQDANLRIIVS